ncbi:D-glycero-alpha-D-manno-heptose 1-phosphate guanylyltransferase [Selenomonas sp. WCT3]|uniref:nucleotidyltransferase family protein n=1 Tax=Selenomonas sp. WCT3 TaxID=3158785 RepID=UPI00088030EF|nr:D-glycero-alpha-D-manno-heptose 1-phosphate guanylyltransferase [Selenomonas ruminantium]
MKKSIGEAIILAGGFGTRLRKVVSDVPKPMAPMDDEGTPFLAFVLDKLVSQGITQVVLSVGYLASVVQEYFGDTYEGIKISYVREDEPLGTGGAVKKALRICRDDDVFVLNGDTYFDVDLVAMKEEHQRCNADFTLAAREMRDFDRYGALEIDENGCVHHFGEKKYCVAGFINGGVYCLRRTLLDNIQQDVFSLEKDFLEKQVECMHVQAFKSVGYFIDIGVPEDYAAAREYIVKNKYGIKE